MSTAVKTSAIKRDARPYTVANLPESDGKPMAETPKHVQQIIYSVDVLNEYFRSKPDVVVYGNIFLYYLDEDETLKRVSPDLLVARGIALDENRRVYSVEQEGKAPDLVIEFTSKKTKAFDLGPKRAIYAWLGVKEYFLFDPNGRYLESQLMGFRLIGGEYVPLTPTDSELRLPSEELGLDLVVVDNNLRYYDPLTRELLRSYKEEAAKRREEAAKRREAEEKAKQEAMARQQEALARQTAEAEVAQLREELARLKKGNA